MNERIGLKFLPLPLCKEKPRPEPGQIDIDVWNALVVALRSVPFPNCADYMPDGIAKEKAPPPAGERRGLLRHYWQSFVTSASSASTILVMPNGSLSLAEYPAAMVRLSCPKCDRSGQYRKATLIAKYGAGISLPELLSRIAASCPKVDAPGNDSCGAHYRDLT